jgi:lipoprotein-anchoring transpeptidase ErfK/SrfK
MPAPARLFAVPEPGTGRVRFGLRFPAPDLETPVFCASAILETGDGQALDLGMVCAPTAFTWSSDHERELAGHTYADGLTDAHLAAVRLRWGDAVIPLQPPLPTPEPVPTTAILTLAEGEPLTITAGVQVEGLAPGHAVRLDGGAGQIHTLHGAAGPAQKATWTLSYPKPGEYTVSLALLDEEGYRLTELERAVVTVAEPIVAPPMVEVMAAEAVVLGLPEVESAAEPWLPYRYFRPVWAWARTYTSPGGSTVGRSLAPGTYLAVDAETLVGGQVWYRTLGRDWIPAAAVALVVPSPLRGVELAGGSPPPPPPPSPPRRGIVVVDTLNVRARPGVAPDNPPIARLTRNTEVGIYEETLVGGDRWYRIGEARWVFAAYVRIISGSPPPSPPAPRRGVVVADALHVRARPGVAPDNPPVDRLLRGTEVVLYEETTVAGAVWYRIGPDRWVHGDWIRVLAAAAVAAAAIPAATDLPVGWVAASTVHVRARPGVAADNPVIGEVHRNQALPILDARAVGNETWYRIGADRWVLGRWIRVARFRPRPAAIGTDQRWVGVNLTEQTAVAYEGDRPVYAAMIASGLPGTPTVQGIFRTWLRLASGKMSGGSTRHGYYYLEGVTWTCYFYAGYALHTAYWHDAFGNPRSHGCVNLSPYDAWWIFQWSAAGGPHSPMVYVYA